MDSAALLAQLRRLSQARPGVGALHLPAHLSPQEAIQAIRAAVKVLEPRAAGRTHPPKARGSTRIHIDGAARGNPGPAGVGVVIIGPNGQVIERAHRSIGEATNNVAEYRALLLALERALALGCTDLAVSSDSELLVRQLQGRYQVRHPTLRGLYTTAKEQIAGFSHFGIQHIPREENAEADALANRAIDEAQSPGERATGSAPGAPWAGGGR